MVSSGVAILNGGAAYLMYRKYVHLADISLEFAGIISASLWEDDSGVLHVNPTTLAGISFDQINRLDSSIKWLFHRTTHT
ncbi:hypothetical protein [Methanospirillum lacunae]|uniref:Uncharacterized protein n=1 Tax=Methanospirillum lacunae TaxID=668570 RepID=A0A2V2MYN0_9EURY|nr:hypothetical protein [Methanospirillum lacunae]PWR71400.1 hypothetical protein DK846_11075 [Methanospirillum lacunae]